MSYSTMRQPAGDIAPLGQSVHVWITRLVPGNNASVVVSRWPAAFTHVSKEDALRMGFADQTLHYLIGPYWKGHLIQPGDQVTKIQARDGTQYVRSNKPWSVVGRTQSRGAGDLSGQSLIIKEEV